MDANEKQERLEMFERLCREAGIPCTIQRRAVLEAVLDRDDPPSAQQVYQAVRASTPGVSRATVHRTLEVLVETGVITRTSHPGNVARYDARTEIHHHLVCVRCNSVTDIFDDRLDSLEIPDTSDYGFEVADYLVQLRGICRDCRARGARNTGHR